MICASSSSGYLECAEQTPISFAQWKTILSKLTKEETIRQLFSFSLFSSNKLYYFVYYNRLPSSSNSHRHRSTSRQYPSPTKNQERQSLPRNQVFSEAVVDSFLLSASSSSSSSNVAQSSTDTPKINSSSTKRYVSSFKTLVNSTSSKHAQRLSYVNDSVIILKLSKGNEREKTGVISQLSKKQSTLSMATSTTTPPRQSSPSPSRLSPILKVEGQKYRTVPQDFALIQSANIDQSIPPNSAENMAISTTSHPTPNPSLVVYRSTLTGGGTVRQRTFAEPNMNSLLITTERLKTNTSSAMRPARQPITATATMPSAYMSSQRNTSQNTRSRVQQDKLVNSKDLFEYSDPFTNCPQDIMNRLAQLTKLQLETIEWEKKRRYTKKKTVTNGTTHGKDSP